MSDWWLTTPRLGFGRWRRTDLDLALALWGDPEVARLIGGPWSAAEVAARLAAEIAMATSHGVQYWPVFLRPTGDLVGAAGLRPRGPRSPTPSRPSGPGSSSPAITPTTLRRSGGSNGWDSAPPTTSSIRRPDSGTPATDSTLPTRPIGPRPSPRLWPAARRRPTFDLAPHSGELPSKRLIGLALLAVALGFGFRPAARPPAWPRPGPDRFTSGIAEAWASPPPSDPSSPAGVMVLS